jgi:hypothetical protein
VPGKCTIKCDVGNREVDLAIGEWDESQDAEGVRKADGSLSIQVCPGREDLLLGDTGILTRKDVRHLRSFSAIDTTGDRGAWHYWGLVVDKYTLKGARDESLTLDLDVKGKWGEAGAPMTPNYADLAAAYILQEMELQVAGQQRIEFDSIEISAEHSLRDDIYGSQLYRQDITTKGRKTSVKLDGFRPEDEALEAAYYDRADVALKAVWTRGSSTLTGTIARARVRGYDPERARQSIELKGLKGTAAGSAPTIEWAVT